MAKKQKSEAHTPLGLSIIKGLNEAIAYAKGQNVDVRVRTFFIPDVDVKAVREKVGLSQPAFAAKFGFKLATLRNWEQRRREPEASAKILIAVIARHPEIIEEVLQEK